MLQSNGKTRRASLQAGFTLLEVLLVLCVLATIVGITWPSVVRYMGDQAILESSQAAQSAAAGTRIKAIDTGLTYQFRYEPQGRRFAVIPFDPAENIDAPASGSITNSGQSDYPVLSGELSENCQFLAPVEGLFASAAVERLPREAFGSLPDAYDLSNTAWAPPVLFYSDGTAVDAIFRIVDDGQRSVEMRIRGLTGAVAAQPLERGWRP